MARKTCLMAMLILIACSLKAQQRPDTSYQFKFSNSYYQPGKGPLIYIDETHNNFHKLSGGFAPFAKLAAHDGYGPMAFTRNTNIENVDILVIANAINEKNLGNWSRPIYQAFEAEEIKRITDWVKNGGRLLLIADHMPFAGAAQDLASAFGFDLCDGFAEQANKENGQDPFSVENKKLLDNPLTDGSYGEKITKVFSFMGSSFTIPKEATGVLKLTSDDFCLMPDVAWEFDETTKSTTLEDSYQGAILNFGKGKVAMFGEAAMFTAQAVTQNGNTFKIGFNFPFASQNVAFVRNVLHWLSEGLAEQEGSSLEREILSVNRKMEEVFNQGSHAQVAKDFYTQDAIMLGNTAEVIGKDNLINYWSNFSGQLEWKLENIEIKPLGEGYALQRGYSNIHYVQADGSKGVSRSIFSLIWKRTEAGWQILLDHFSPRGPNK